MNQAITITSESVAELLNELQVRNYDPSQHSLQDEYNVGLTYPAPYAGVSSIGEDDSRLTMLASEAVLAREWNTPEEDEAWAHL
jgi:hypothetical protein